MKNGVLKFTLLIVVLGFSSRVFGQSYRELLESNDINLENLRGPVNYISLKGTYKGEKNLEVLKHYLRDGQLKQVSVTLPGRDEIEFLMNKLSPEEFTYETRILYNYGEHDEFVHPRSKYEIRGWGRDVDYSFYYNGDDKISKVESSEEAIRSFTYDTEGRLEKKITPHHEVHYEWLDNNLESKKVYWNEDGSNYYDYQITYFPSKIIVSETKFTNGTSQSIITYFLDENGRISKRRIENFLEGRQGKYVSSYHTRNYQYNSAGELIESNSEGSYLNDRYQKFIVPFRDWYEIMRDRHGNITRIKTKKEKITDHGESIFEDNYNAYLEWEYDYDTKGNWIRRICNEVKENDLKITTPIEEINRKIFYFSKPDRAPNKNTYSKEIKNYPYNAELSQSEKGILRAEPNTNSSVVTEVYPKELITVLEKVEGTNWCKVRVNEKEGYITEGWLMANDSQQKVDFKSVGGMGLDGDGNYRLGGRKALTKEKPIRTCTEKGTVVVYIKVDASGNVLKAVPGYEGSTTTSECLYEPSKKAALATKFNIDSNSPLEQEGVILYNY